MLQGPHFSAFEERLDEFVAEHDAFVGVLYDADASSLARFTGKPSSFVVYKCTSARGVFAAGYAGVNYRGRFSGPVVPSRLAVVAHHKFIVGLTASSEPEAVWTGSLNLKAVSMGNDENVVILADREFAAAYLAEWDALR